MSKPTTGLRRAGIASFATGALALSACVVGAGAASADADFAFERIAGDNRYETAGEVYDAFGTSDSVILANGEQGHYPDALVANYLAGVEGSPILLTRSDKMPEATQSRLDAADKTITIVGGEGVVSAEQEASLEADGHTVTRLAGDNRYETAAAVIDAAGDAASNTALISTGVDFPDALAAGPVSFDQGSPLAISRVDDIHDAEVAELVESGVSQFIVVGGPNVVGAEVVEELEDAGLEFLTRLAGDDRAATSVAVADYAIENYGFTDEAINVASGYVAGTGADALAGGPLSGQNSTANLITRNVNNPGDSVLAFLSDHCPTLGEGNIFGGPGAVSAAAETAMETAAQSCAGSGELELPELVDADILGTVAASEATTDNPAGTTVRFTFDEGFATAGGLGPNEDNFLVYTSAADGVDGDDIVGTSGNSVDVLFGGITTDEGAAALTVATVDDGAVRQTDGDTNPEGDAPLGSTTGGGTTNLPAGITEGPDLVSVGGFREASPAFPDSTAVDFTFDEAASSRVIGTTADDFVLHLLNGDTIDGTAPVDEAPAPGGGTIPGGDDTTTITVVFAGDITAADVARGTVNAGSVEEATNNESAGDDIDQNPLQAAHVSNEGETTGPDLSSVTLRANSTGAGDDQAIFTFDENVEGAVGPASSFGVYDTEGNRVAGDGIAEVNGGQVLVNLLPAGVVNAVGGNVFSGAITGGEEDEEGVSNTAPVPTVTAGKTSAPDLTGVSVAVEDTALGDVTGADATFTFDEAITGADPVEANFHLYLADGSQLNAGTGATDCVVGPATGDADDNTVVCEFTGPADNLDEAVDAVLGTVDFAAVTDDEGDSNPEGAEPVA